MTVDEYLKNVTPTQKEHYDRVKKIVKDLAPDAEEVISYGIPTLKHKGTYVIYWAAFKNHMSLFPGSSAVSSSKELEKFRAAKGTLHFTEANPIPDHLIKELVQQRLHQINSKGKKDY